MTAIVGIHDYTLQAGDPDDIPLFYTDSLDAPITTLTGATLYIRKSYGSAIKLQKAAVIDAPNGGMTFSLTAAELDALVPTTGEAIPTVAYDYSIRVTLSTGISPRTIQKGTFTVVGDTGHA